MTIPQPYNLSITGNNVTAIVGLTQTVNDNLMNGYFGLLTLITFFLITMMISFVVTRGSANKSFMSASIATFVIAMLFRVMALVSDLIFYSFLALAALSIAFVKNR